MSSFTTPLIVSPMDDGRNWELKAKFTYHIGSKFSRKWVNVPAGFVTDFASVPRIFFFLPGWATYSKAPILHDWLYGTQTLMGKPITRKKADQIFLEVMHVDWRTHKSRYFVAHLEYIAVRLFGVWDGNKKGGGGITPPPLFLAIPCNHRLVLTNSVKVTNASRVYTNTQTTKSNPANASCPLPA